MVCGLYLIENWTIGVRPAWWLFGGADFIASAPKCQKP